MLFVSDYASNALDIFAFPNLRKISTISEVSEPTGLCAGPEGVWVVEYNSSAELFDPTGKYLRALQYAGISHGCAVAPNGDLAIADQPGGGVNDVLTLFKHAKGKPLTATCPSMEHGYMPAYDTSGTLWMVGLITYASKATLCTGGDSGPTLRGVRITGGTIYQPGMMQWLGATLVIGDHSCGASFQEDTCLYELSIINRNVAHIFNKVTILAPDSYRCALEQGVIYKGSLYGACANGGDVYRWHWPRGGVPEKIGTGGMLEGYGTAILRATKSPGSH